MRRAWLVLAFGVLALAACRRSDTVGGIRFVEIFSHGADEKAPLVVGLHGRGGAPERLAGLFDPYPGTAQIALAQAPLPLGSGWQWFDWPPGTSEEKLSEAMGAAEEKLWPAIAA